MEILLCTDGSGSSLQSADLIAKIGFPVSARIVVLGVNANKSELEKLNNSMELLEQKLSSKYSISRKIRSGDPVEEILAEALDHPYDLVAVGSGSKSFDVLQPKLGSTAGSLARKLHTHFLVSRNVPAQLHKILLCVGPDTPSNETIAIGGAWIANASSSVGLLHVSQPNKEDDKSSAAIVDRATRQLSEAGVKSAITPLLRQGLVVDEVLAELSQGGYDLLMIGAHYQPGMDLWQQSLLDDVADRLLNRSSCSVLII